MPKIKVTLNEKELNFIFKELEKLYFNIHARKVLRFLISKLPLLKDE